MPNPTRAEPRTAYVLPLDALDRTDAVIAGAKAANLGALARAGFPVPGGFVLTTTAFERFLADGGLGPDASLEQVTALPFPADVAEALAAVTEAFAEAPLAVRSSAVAEDLPGASFAGQYETVLRVRGTGAVIEALRRCWASAFGDRVTAYQAARVEARASMAVLLQRLVQADAAGVAFTANPVNGDRAETVVSAVRGLGDRLVSGQAAPDEWVVRGGEAVCRVVREGSISADQARAVADLARRVETHFDGVPQDVEWAIAAGELFLLQARLITSLPVHVEWKSPGAGGWARNFRIGEWLGDPVTPLFETWLLPRLDERFWAQNERLIGVPPRPNPPYAVVDGWFFASVNMWTYGLAGTIWALASHPRALRLAALMSPATARRAAATFVREWREVALPHYRALTEADEARVDVLPPVDLVRLIDDLATAAGDYFVWVPLVGGNGWKNEIPLARFYHQNLRARIGGSHQRLLVGLTMPAPAPHAVYSLDWFHPTLGETGVVSTDDGAVARRANLEASRRAAETEARAALRTEPRLLRRFELLLATAQYFAALREEVVPALTLAWPIMRRALLRLGEGLRERHVLASDSDVFFLTRDELLAVLSAEPAPELATKVTERRARWQNQRRLTPPLLLGEPPPSFVKSFLFQAEAARSSDVAAEAALKGLPASPGRVTGPARIIRGPEEFDRLQPGDVLVAPATAPAWTPLFARCVAVVTDSGSVLAHASLIAREYGIPAVVGTVDATARMRDGQVVTVDGGAGVVEMHPG